MSNRYRWYLSAKAVRDYLIVAGHPDDDGGPVWARAEAELGAHCAAAHYVSTDTTTGTETWRTGRVQCGDGRTRLEFSVRNEKRPEGPLAQLVRVRDKGGKRSGRAR